MNLFFAYFECYNFGFLVHISERLSVSFCVQRTNRAINEMRNEFMRKCQRREFSLAACRGNKTSAQTATTGRQSLPNEKSPLVVNGSAPGCLEISRPESRRTESMVSACSSAAMARSLTHGNNGPGPARQLLTVELTVGVLSWSSNPTRSASSGDHETHSA